MAELELTAGMTHWVFDDRPSKQETIGSTLLDFGHQVVPVESVMVGVELLRDAESGRVPKPDALWLDYYTDGDATWREILLASAELDEPLLAVTAADVIDGLVPVVGISEELKKAQELGTRLPDSDVPLHLDWDGPGIFGRQILSVVGRICEARRQYPWPV